MCFACTRTENCLEILSNPNRYYSKTKPVKNDDLTCQKWEANPSNSTGSIYKEIETNREGIEDSSYRAISSIPVEKEKIKIKKKKTTKHHRLLLCLPYGAAATMSFSLTLLTRSQLLQPLPHHL